MTVARPLDLVAILEDAGCNAAALGVRYGTNTLDGLLESCRDHAQESGCEECERAVLILEAYLDGQQTVSR